MIVGIIKVYRLKDLCIFKVFWELFVPLKDTDSNLFLNSIVYNRFVASEFGFIQNGSLKEVFCREL